MSNQNQRPYRTSIGWIVSFSALLLIALTVGTANAQNANATANSNGRSSTNANANSSVNPNANRTGSANSNAASTTTTTKLPCPAAEELAQVLVTRAFRSTRIGEETKQAQGTLGDEITLEVQGLKVLMQKAQCTNPSKRILLFLDGKPLKEVTPFPPTNPEKDLLIFSLKRTEASRDVWAYILGEPSWSPRKTNVSVGLEDEYAVQSTASIEMEVIPHGPFTFWAFLLVLLIILFLLMAVKSDLLRDPGAQPLNGARKAYSLSRVQGAWWFFIVLTSYLFIGIVTGDFTTTITGTVLILLGISAGTVIGSTVIDAGRAASSPAAPGAAPAEAAAPAAAQPAPPSEFWLIDIITDVRGVSFPRFQNAVWTLVLGIIFITQVYKVLAMPTFDATLLSLMGISAGTYLGMKIPEPK